MQPEYDFIKELLSDVLGQSLFYPSDVVRIIENLGGITLEEFVIADLRPKSINPNSYNINISAHGVEDTLYLFTGKTVWNYLKELEALRGEGKVDLTDIGIKDLYFIARGYSSNSEGIHAGVNTKAGIAPSADYLPGVLTGFYEPEDFLDEQSRAEEILYLQSQEWDNSTRSLEDPR